MDHSAGSKLKPATRAVPCSCLPEVLVNTRVIEWIPLQVVCLIAFAWPDQGAYSKLSKNLAALSMSLKDFVFAAFSQWLSRPISFPIQAVMFITRNMPSR